MIERGTTDEEYQAGRCTSRKAEFSLMKARTKIEIGPDRHSEMGKDIAESHRPFIQP